MKRILLIVNCIVILSFLIGCGEITPIEEIPEVVEEEAEEQPVEEILEEVPEEVEEPVEEPLPEVVVPESCTNNSDCIAGEMCVDGECGNIADLYGEECGQKCKIKEIEILTSDGQTLTLPPGQGSYTAAGALDWTIQRMPEYCPGDSVRIPVLFIKKSYSTVYGEEVVTIKVGETSKVITHPVISRIQFTLTVNDVVEECS